MPWLIALILVAGGLCLAGLAVRAQAQEAPAPVTVEKMSTASNAEIEQMLRKIETSPAPEPKMGAMCYRVSMPEPITEYVCPVCGEKTVYPIGERGWSSPLHMLEPLQVLQSAANQAAAGKQASVTLDERQFCRKCLPDFTNAPQAVLVVKLPDGQEQRTPEFSITDFQILRDFFSGKAEVTGGNDFETPLKNDLSRLRELLGLKE